MSYRKSSYETIDHAFGKVQGARCEFNCNTPKLFKITIFFTFLVMKELYEIDDDR